MAAGVHIETDCSVTQPYRDRQADGVRASGRAEAAEACHRHSGASCAQAWAITMQFPGREFYTSTTWPPADALLYGVLGTCARLRAGLGQVLTSRTVFSYREPAKIG